MGYDTRQLTVTALVSRHNSPQDKIDDEAWEHLGNVIREEIDTHPERYEKMHVQVVR
jgi:hypothetical protein